MKGIMVLLAACALFACSAAPALAGDTARCHNVAGIAMMSDKPSPGNFVFEGVGLCEFQDDDGDDFTFPVSVTMHGDWDCHTSKGQMVVLGMIDDKTPIQATADYSLTFSGANGALTLTNTRDNDPDATSPGTGNGTFTATPAPMCQGVSAMTGSFEAVWDQN